MSPWVAPEPEPPRNPQELDEGRAAAEIAEPEPGRCAHPQEVLMRFVAELPTVYRTVFNLYCIEERSHKEIAELLGINEKSSRRNSSARGPCWPAGSRTIEVAGMKMKQNTGGPMSCGVRCATPELRPQKAVGASTL